MTLRDQEEEHEINVDEEFEEKEEVRIEESISVSQNFLKDYLR